MSLTIAKNGSVTLSKARLMVCLEATWELEVLAFLLPTLVPNIDEAHGAHHAVRGIAGRLVSLTGVLAGALWDEVEKTGDLERIVLATSPCASEKS